ncbi:NAD(P)-dependent dehydrogenase (short-subunit alcohol dehydrogenase family) [Bradyrhizobium sp. AZCC 2289]
MSNPEGKVAVVTGGSSGIGLATAKRLAEAGAHIFITTPKLTDKAKAEIGPRALRNLREVRAMQQQTAYSSWITVPVG